MPTDSHDRRPLASDPPRPSRPEALRLPVPRAVILAGGLGTRMLPVTKVLPKELLPVHGKPVIQRAMEEVVGTGIREVILVVAPAKTSLVHYLVGPDPAELAGSGPLEDLAKLMSGVKLHVLVQRKPLEVGEVMGEARTLLGDEPFALVLPDNLLAAPETALTQMLRCFQKERVSLVGMVNPPQDGRGYLPVRDVSCPPARDGLLRLAPSRDGRNVRFFGRYILSPDLFAALPHVGAMVRGEWPLPAPLIEMLAAEKVLGCLLAGDPYDVGHPDGYRLAHAANPW